MIAAHAAVLGTDLSKCHVTHFHKQNWKHQAFQVSDVIFLFFYLFFAFVKEHYISGYDEWVDGWTNSQ